ncbi:MAG: MocR-like transcription factor YczR [Gaiellaceae bacterium]
MIGAPRMLELLGKWRGGGPAHDELAVAIRGLVLDGQIPVGTQLPAERALATALGVSRTTVTHSYNRLRTDGFVSSRQGSGSFASLPARALQAADAILPTDGVDLRIAALTAPPNLAEVVAEAVGDLPRWLDHHGYDPLGLPPLRAAIARRFTARGLPTTADQILVTNGALQALDLELRAHLVRGRMALVEIPTYPAALGALRAAGARIQPVAVSYDGWDVEALLALGRRREPALAYLIPDFQNPTGALMDESSRRAVARGLERLNCRMLIDETFVELAHDGERLPSPFAAHGGSGIVTIGSLSKAYWGGLRIGWIRSDPATVQRLALTRANVDTATPVLDQLVATHVVNELDALLPERRRTVVTRRRALTGALRAHLPEWRFEEPRGGLFVWAELPRPESSAIANRARDIGLHLSPGPRFGRSGLLERFLRLPYALPPETLERAVVSLAGIVALDTTSPARESVAMIV